MRPVGEPLVSMRALPALAQLMVLWDIGSAHVPRRLELFGELVIGIIVETAVLALGIFMLVTLACAGLL
jgi:hypothetical protein